MTLQDTITKNRSNSHRMMFGAAQAEKHSSHLFTQKTSQSINNREAMVSGTLPGKCLHIWRGSHDILFVQMFWIVTTKSFLIWDIRIPAINEITVKFIYHQSFDIKLLNFIGHKESSLLGEEIPKPRTDMTHGNDTERKNKQMGSDKLQDKEHIKPPLDIWRKPLRNVTFSPATWGSCGCLWHWSRLVRSPTLNSFTPSQKTLISGLHTHWHIQPFLWTLFCQQLQQPCARKDIQDDVGTHPQTTSGV